MNAPHPDRRSSSVDLSPAIARALVSFTASQSAWAESTTQDAIESVARMKWLYQVRSGVRVPIDTLYTQSARRLARTEVSHFIETLSTRVSPILQLPTPALRSYGWDVMEKTAPIPPTSDPLIYRSWSESEVPWRLRFEQSVRTEIRIRATTPLQDWLESTLLNVVARWNGSTPRRLVRETTFH
jgi:hypothetical protein